MFSASRQRFRRATNFKHQKSDGLCMFRIPVPIVTVKSGLLWVYRPRSCLAQPFSLSSYGDCLLFCHLKLVPRVKWQSRTKSHDILYDTLWVDHCNAEGEQNAIPTAINPIIDGISNTIIGILGYVLVLSVIRCIFCILLLVLSWHMKNCSAQSPNFILVGNSPNQLERAM